MTTDTAQRRKERIDRGIKVRSDGIYALLSWRELAYLSVPRLVLILGILALPLLMPGMYWQRVISIVCIYAFLAMSFDFLAHYVGLVSLGGAFFVGTGGYIAALLNTTFGLPPLVTIPAALILGAAVCTLLLIPCLPLRGVYFAIVTLMYPLFMARLIEALDIFGGTDGILGIDSFTNPWVEQYFVVVMVLVLLFGLRRLVNTDLGLVLRAVKDNDQAVRASGMNVTRYKALAVFIAAGMGCLSGACLVHTYMWAGISQFALDFSVLPIAATVIGGSGTLVGPVLGCLILVPASELLRDFGTLRIVFYSLILVTFIVFRSEGLMVYGQRKYHQFQRWTEI
ncbi:High-affinity branched-chain amino acid transport system permease protein LivH (TC 3.A.1.4.1) / Branched-chain amino acid transport system permease protein LivM (TC 3.A.1.4.1) [Olavius algarvensis associated proteobacterium Delta 3]|nr:High-affinity branched-chain amino acid transport system permease protein LivH (TC 3.A.1.4.1) / Branched-chain amino acid transport system permease protein LivM (TC 3.A.1.4.1) [Olavius algarvensis associated proteobacterium Delta 3]CAB5126676.1 High-affinity branched-chain amino acid transport system permease protein LivH (TC 3.A.1.4.1) / Branched-chain amino acid transport system permease protein LivM (TC 3.A.1.4.1) [Olavius algarvensis associated proteobacterium Delta 3]